MWVVFVVLTSISRDSCLCGLTVCVLSVSRVCVLPGLRFGSGLLLLPMVGVFTGCSGVSLLNISNFWVGISTGVLQVDTVTFRVQTLSLDLRVPTNRGMEEQTGQIELIILILYR